MPLDAHRQWYRYHHLFRELLRAELVRAEPELVPRLLARAADWCEANGQPEAAIGYVQEAGDVDRAARLFVQSAVPMYESGQVATAERWLHWLERNGALERNAAIAVLGAIEATTQGRPAEAERWAEAAEHASCEGPLPDGSASIDSWRAVLRAARCQGGAVKMHADAALAVQTLARWSPLRPSALLFYALSQWLAGEVDEADDLLADAAEEGLELGGEEAAAVALAERAAFAIERGAWVKAEEFAEQALRVIRRKRLGEYPASALAYALVARVALHRGETERAREFLAQAQRLRPRLTYAAPYFAVQIRLELTRAYVAIADVGGAETMLREIDALLRRQPDLGALPAQAAELRARLKTMRADAPGVSSLTEAELRLLPHLATHLSFREIGERQYVSRHTVKSHAVAVYRKLNVSSRNGAVERARELGLL